MVWVRFTISLVRNRSRRVRGPQLLVLSRSSSGLSSWSGPVAEWPFRIKPTLPMEGPAVEISLAESGISVFYEDEADWDTMSLINEDEKDGRTRERQVVQPPSCERDFSTQGFE